MFAGSRMLTVADDAVSFRAWVLYPTTVAAAPVAFGRYSAEVSPDAPVAEGRYAVVAVSHGSGGSPFVYRGLAAYLARHGFVVVLPEHPGNNRNDNRLADAPENLVNRPRHVRLALDHVVGDDAFAGRVWPDRSAVIGHSLGGYTALALAGGKPWSRAGEPIPVEADARVKALVLLAPAVGWFLPPGALRAVTAPITIYVGEHDGATPAAHARLVADQVPDPAQVTYEVVPGAGHYAFLTPFPPEMKRADFPPSIDPPGFDRPAFHARLELEVREFLDRTLD